MVAYSLISLVNDIVGDSWVRQADVLKVEKIVGEHGRCTCIQKSPNSCQGTSPHRVRMGHLEQGETIND